MKLINKADIISEIERRIKELEPFKTEDNLRAHGAIAGYYQILSFIRTLEVKEVDLDSEIILWANAIPEIRLDDVERLAKYFFELGLKAQKGE